MDLRQKKLEKNEWEALEVPVGDKELSILKMIRDAYDNVNQKWNSTLSILTFMKITKNLDMYHDYFFTCYFKKIIETLVKKYEFTPYKMKKKKKKN